MFLKLNAAAMIGLEGAPVEVEVDVSRGQTNFNIVGLTDTAIQEARDRIHSAIKNSGFTFPFNCRLLINLAPAHLPKEGSSYDLPMAVGIVSASQELSIKTDDALMVGELALDGNLRRTNGILPIALFAEAQGLRRIFIPEINASEAALAKNLEIYPVKNLRQIIKHFTGEELITPFKNKINQTPTTNTFDEMDMAYVKGQEFAKRALEIAASGGHNIILSGPPGSGKTLLARTLPSILPSMSLPESIEVTKIYSVAGILPDNQPLITTRPFRTPHHSASAIALVGGGRIPHPGEITLAHRGVLFLDEFPEFPRFVLENLRQPLEDGTITIARAGGTFSFPAKFILVASQNPCPCGYSSDPEKICTCTAHQILQYHKKISGPILDRIDLQVEVPQINFEKLTQTTPAESSASIRTRVEEARARQTKRFKDSNIYTNSEMKNKDIRNYCQLNNESMEILRLATTQLHLSARGFNRLLKLARTIADLSGQDKIQTEHMAEALQYRTRQNE